MRHTSFKTNESFTELLKIAHTSKQELADHILKKAIEANVIYDEPEFCGELLVNHFAQFGYKPEAATLYCLGVATKRIVRLFRGLQVERKWDDSPVWKN